MDIQIQIYSIDILHSGITTCRRKENPVQNSCKNFQGIILYHSGVAKCNNIKGPPDPPEEFLEVLLLGSGFTTM